MCLIAYGMKADMPRDKLTFARNRNSDGWGFMWAKDGRVHHVRGMGGENEFFSAWESQAPDDVPVAVHFRMATLGAKNLTNCHPFDVLNTDRGDKFDLFLMHNGPRLGDCNGSQKRSDSREFVEDMLKPALQSDPRKIRAAYFQRLLKAFASSDKLLILEGNGKVHIINEAKGHKEDKVWYSNTYSLPSKYVAPAYNHYSTHYYNQNEWMDGDYTARQEPGGRVVYTPATAGASHGGIPTTGKPCPERNWSGCLNGCTGQGVCKSRDLRMNADKRETSLTVWRKGDDTPTLVPGRVAEMAKGKRGRISNASSLFCPKGQARPASCPVTQSGCRYLCRIGEDCHLDCAPSFSSNSKGTQSLLERIKESGGRVQSIEAMTETFSWERRDLLQMGNSEIFNQVIQDAHGCARYMCEESGHTLNLDVYQAIIADPDEATECVLDLITEVGNATEIVDTFLGVEV